MAIYRGPGGAGDATADAVSEASLIKTLAVDVQADADAAEAAKVAAQSSQTAAASSATSAASSATSAANSASSASSSASTATTKASEAATSATNAANSATAAQTAETNAETAETNAAASASAAATSASQASTSASNAATSASNAASSASTASTQATNAANSASAAATSATNAAASATSASNSASTATTQATNASNSASAAATSASNAASSATSASNSASTATTQATNASNSASAAATSASNAATSATNAANSASSAATSATNAANSFDAFDDRYLGSKTSAPSLDNDGNALINGALYFDTTLNIMRVYSTTGGWQSITNALASEPVRHSVRPSLLLDFANTKTLDPRITFTRGSTATFYDGKTVAKAEENLYQYSQDFDNAFWQKVFVSVTANSVTAPDGTLTADTITADGTSNQHYIAGSDVAGAKTISVFAKAGTGSFIQIATGGTSVPYANFDLSSGTANAFGTGTTASITSVGNGWYRCVMYTDASLANANRIAIVSSLTAARIETFTSSATVYLWGVQAEQRSSVTAYTPTTTAPITNYIPALQTAGNNVPRFEHNPVTGESLGLEIEEQRTNLLVRSEEFDNASWTKTGATITANTVVAPDGTLTSDAIVESTASSQKAVFQAQTLTAAAHTFSVYAKRGNGAQRWLTLFPQGSGVSANTIFDINAGTVVASAGAQHLSSSITSVGNGWYRCSITFTAAAVSVTNVIYLTNNTANSAPTYTGDGFSGAFIWGAQLEAGSFATSYIPTVASQVTRSADSASMTGTNFSSWYRADEGTVYSESVMSNVVSKNFWSLSDNTLNEYFQLNTTSGGVSRISAVDNGTTQASLLSATLSANTLFKASFAYKVNDFAFTVNAGTVQTDTSGTLPAIDRIYIGGGHSGGVTIGGTVSKLAYYPKRLTNAELQGLTTV